MGKAILTVLAVTLSLAATGSGATRATVAGAGALPAGWTHAEINYFVNRTAHTLIIDRGQVTAVSQTGFTLREQDGTPVQIATSSATQVNVDGSPGTLADIRRGVTAMTQRIDGGAATVVRVHVPPRLARVVANQRAARR